MIALIKGALIVGALALGVSPPVVDATSTTSASLVALHSRPSAAITVYLDFDGHATVRTRWNHTYTSGAPIVTTAFDLDGEPASWSAAELTWVESIWAGVAEDFAPFDIDVTTEDPGVEALRYSGRRDESYGVRVVIGPDRAWYGRSSSGVAHIGSLGAMTTRPGLDEPAFVFATGSLMADPVKLADAASHEVGHMFGLHHDGVAPAAQNSNDSYEHGSGLWGPIMGAPYGVSLSQWSRGEYPAANNDEDDIATIAGRAGLVPDDVGDRPASAKVLSPGTPVEALVGRATDVDVFRVRVRATTVLTVSVSCLAPSPFNDLNVGLVLRDEAGHTLAADAPVGPDEYGAEVTTRLAPGTYYAVVDGIGEQSSDGTGFSDYGSLGRYRIAAT